MFSSRLVSGCGALLWCRVRAGFWILKFVAAWELKSSVAGQMLNVFGDACCQNFGLSVLNSALRVPGENPG